MRVIYNIRLKSGNRFSDNVMRDLARFPARWNHLAEKDSRQINMLEQILIAKVFNFGGICFNAPPWPLQ
jgi:hypothetical protein